MNRFPSCFISALAVAAGLASTPALAADPPVQVTFTDPAKFSDLRISRPTSARERAGLTDQLRRYLEAEAPRHLPPDTHLAVTITDVDMAGELRPVGHGGQPDVRIVKDMFPPRVDLEFRLAKADGTVVSEGKRELRDSMFLTNTSLNERDLLIHEKALLGRWLEREFPAPR